MIFQFRLMYFLSANALIPFFSLMIYPISLRVKQIISSDSMSSDKMSSLWFGDILSFLSISLRESPKRSAGKVCPLFIFLFSLTNFSVNSFKRRCLFKLNFMGLSEFKWLPTTVYAHLQVYLSPLYFYLCSTILPLSAYC